jgi:hypothetical protein
MRRRTFLSFAAAPLAAAPRSEKAGWIQVRLEGSPKEIGVQHGALLRNEILDNFAAVKLMVTHDAKPWGFLREAAERVLWPRVEQEYREEIDGIVEGLGRKLDRWDVVALNAYLELVPYYTNWYDGQKNPKKSAPEHCSAFVATGSWTRDGRPVIAHNAWTDYAIGARWNVIFDIRPAKGHRILMDGMPGLIHSGDDFGVNAAGIAITETTISQFNGFDPKGIPEFVRARKAMQYAASIDDFARLMREGNNGGYANNWLVADMARNEVASLELGLKHTPLRRTNNGYFLGANFPVDEKLAREETTFDNTNLSLSPCARRLRWEQLMAEHKGKIDIELAKRFLGDDYDSFEKKRQPNERGLCGRNDFSPRGMPPWQLPYGPAGAVQNKAADAALAKRMSLWAAMGPQCGPPFRAAQFLKEHPEFAWQKPVLKDLPGQPWTLFRAE